MGSFFETFEPLLTENNKKMKEELTGYFQKQSLWLEKLQDDLNKFKESGILQYNAVANPIKIKKEKRSDQPINTQQQDNLIEGENLDELPETQKENRPVNHHAPPAQPIQFKEPPVPPKKKLRTAKEANRSSDDVAIIQEKISIVNLVDEPPIRCTRSKTKNALTASQAAAKKVQTPKKAPKQPAKKPPSPDPPRLQPALDYEMTKNNQTFVNYMREEANEAVANATFIATKRSGDVQEEKTVAAMEVVPKMPPPNRAKSPQAGGFHLKDAPTKKTLVSSPTKGDPHMSIPGSLNDYAPKAFKSARVPTRVLPTKMPISEKANKLRAVNAAAQKKETHLLAQSEEIKRKLEERMQKAKQCRIEIEEAKMEKLKQTLAEKEKKMTPLQIRLQEKRKIETKSDYQETPIYMKMKMPLLPTYDCYDSDDERNVKRKAKKLDWERDMKPTLEMMQHIDDRYIDSLFRSVKNPDLVQIFKRGELRKVKRTSSAIWSHAPLSSVLSETITEEGSD